MAQPTRVFLDVNIGSASEHDVAAAAYERATQFLARHGAEIGLDPSIALDVVGPEDTELLLSAYAARPEWSARGAASVQRPLPLLAGRVIVQLYDAEVPKAAENFRCLCTGERGLGKESKRLLHYKARCCACRPLVRAAPGVHGPTA